jgi:hypothetical protein
LTEAAASLVGCGQITTNRCQPGLADPVMSTSPGEIDKLTDSARVNELNIRKKE